MATTLFKEVTYSLSKLVEDIELIRFACPSTRRRPSRPSHTSSGDIHLIRPDVHPEVGQGHLADRRQRLDRLQESAMGPVDLKRSVTHNFSGILTCPS